MSLEVYIDGKYYPKEQARVSVYDHGLLYGDGVFEGIRAYSGRVFRLDEHLERLYASARSVAIEIPMNLPEMRTTVLETLRRNGLRDSYIRLMVTRGVGDLGLDPRKCNKASVIVITDTIKLYPADAYEHGLRIIIASTRKNSPDCLSPRIKSMNYLNNILAKIEAIGAGVAESLMLDKNGFLTECTSENIFIVKNRTLYTPTSVVGILEGITRSVVMELAQRAGIEVQMAFLTPHDLYTADESFVTGTGAEILPVVEVGQRKIGDGKVGSITRQLLSAFRELTQREGTLIFEPDPASV
ncbi:MAG: branched-chain-amino-acid transaminase [Candidatus Eremiobacteraeota bacterium]|nr:branched-chain-amino-acid transaminase [Candidatus Eremiobacteraeota bacterium]MCW5868091.1 branched-chain-amino-acid transaminase [Candidatus Eremiobacteraeota bacterium]